MEGRETFIVFVDVIYHLRHFNWLMIDIEVKFHTLISVVGSDLVQMLFAYF